MSPLKARLRRIGVPPLDNAKNSEAWRGTVMTNPLMYLGAATKRRQRARQWFGVMMLGIFLVLVALILRAAYGP